MNDKMIEIDGSSGEGGGQILRTSLSLSMITGIPFTMKNIRKKRNNPGLQRQHLAAVRAAVSVSGAETEGAYAGSPELVFAPGTISAGNYLFEVGTAGSASLVLQTVLPALLFKNGASEITLTGGTHNPFAPPYDFLEKTFIGTLNAMGYRISSGIERYGFYPVGGGKFTVKIQPSNGINELKLSDRGSLIERNAKAVSSHLPDSVNEKEIAFLKQRLKWDDDEYSRLNVESPGPGNAVIITMHYENITEVFIGFGAKNIPGYSVVDEACAGLEEYLAGKSPVGKHLADQLLLPLSIGRGGTFNTTGITAHTETNIRMILKFLDIGIGVERISENDFTVSVKC